MCSILFGTPSSVQPCVLFVQCNPGGSNTVRNYRRIELHHVSRRLHAQNGDSLTSSQVAGSDNTARSEDCCLLILQIIIASSWQTHLPNTPTVDSALLLIDNRGIRTQLSACERRQVLFAGEGCRVGSSSGLIYYAAPCVCSAAFCTHVLFPHGQLHILSAIGL